MGTYRGESKVGNYTGCLQPAGKQAQTWDSIELAVLEQASGAGKAERPWQN